MLFADLHNHTTSSDGDFSPEQLVEQAKNHHIKALGVTDHDTLAGLDDAVKAGNRVGIRVIPGVEVSIRFKRPYFTGTLHLLCYFSPDLLNEKKFTDEFNMILSQGRGESLVKARIAEINKVFGPGKTSALLHREMVYEDIASLSDNATRRHFAIALEKTFGIEDNAVRNQIIGNDSAAYLPSGIDLTLMVDFIKTYPMVSALAHPAAGSYSGGGHYKEVLPPVEIVEKILPEFLEAGINGLEVYYPGHNKEHIRLLETWAQKYNLVMTGGSDCHDAKDRPFGVQGLDEKQFETFIKVLANP